jgi:hypothetical protein
MPRTAAKIKNSNEQKSASATTAGKQTVATAALISTPTPAPKAASAGTGTSAATTSPAASVAPKIKPIVISVAEAKDLKVPFVLLRDEPIHYTRTVGCFVVTAANEEKFQQNLKPITNNVSMETIKNGKRQKFQLIASDASFEEGKEYIAVALIQEKIKDSRDYYQYYLPLNTPGLFYWAKAQGQVYTYARQDVPKIGEMALKENAKVKSVTGKFHSTLPVVDFEIPKEKLKEFGKQMEREIKNNDKFVPNRNYIQTFVIDNTDDKKSNRQCVGKMYLVNKQEDFKPLFTDFIRSNNTLCHPNVYLVRNGSTYPSLLDSGIIKPITLEVIAPDSEQLSALATAQLAATKSATKQADEKSLATYSIVASFDPILRGEDFEVPGDRENEFRGYVEERGVEEKGVKKTEFIVNRHYMQWFTYTKNDTATKKNTEYYLSKIFFVKERQEFDALFSNTIGKKPELLEVFRFKSGTDIKALQQNGIIKQIRFQVTAPPAAPVATAALIAATAAGRATAATSTTLPATTAPASAPSAGSASAAPTPAPAAPRHATATAVRR